LVAPRLTQFLDCAVQTVIEVNECIRRPKPSLHFFPGHHLSRPLQQHGQYLERLVLELDPKAAFA
jgi:hypothetical protein